MNKNLIELCIALLISIASFAQQGINYKALIKDVNGNVLVNENNMSVQFTIYQGAALTNSVYIETHTNVSTDANGIIILNIGNGITTEVFTDIVWGNDQHWLNVQINTGSGFTDMGTTQFMTVPYAKHAENVSGLGRVFEGTSPLSSGPASGWRFVDLLTGYYANIGHEAVDLSSTFFGQQNYHGASGSFSTAMNLNTRASGHLSVATGLFTKAESYNSFVIGRYNIGGGNPGNPANPFDFSYWISTDPLFEIGNGEDNENRNNALTIYKNGNAKFDSEIQHTSTGDANLVPIAYGTIESNGNVRSGTGNFTASLSAGILSINVIGKTMTVDNTACVITPYSTSFRTSSLIISGGDIDVRIFNSSGNLAPVTFQFVIYKL